MARKKQPKQNDTIQTVHNTVSAWYAAALAMVVAYIADLTAPGEGLPHADDTPEEGKARASRKVMAAALTVPPLRIHYGFPSSQAFADTKLTDPDSGDSIRLARRRFDLWPPSSDTIGRERIADNPLTAETVEEAAAKGVTVGSIIHGATLRDSLGNITDAWQLFMSPRIGAGLTEPGDRETEILITMLHAATLAAIDGGDVTTYDPEKNPKAYAKFPRGKREPYGQTWQKYAPMLGFAEPSKRESFVLRQDQVAVFRAMVLGSDDFPQPLGMFPEASVHGFKTKRIGAGPQDLSRNRKVFCPAKTDDDNDRHFVAVVTRTFAPDVEDEATGLVSCTVADFIATCGAPDCGRRLTVEEPKAIKLYNESLRRYPGDRTKALMIASGEIAPPWTDAAANANTPAEAAEAATA